MKKSIVGLALVGILAMLFCIVIPGRDGSTGMGLSALNSAVERAVGMNILDKE